MISILILLIFVSFVGSQQVMPWMCLERCFNQKSTDIEQHLKDFERNKGFYIIILRFGSEINRFY